MTPLETTLSGCICGDKLCSIPYGLCHCGCGRKVSLEVQTIMKKSVIKGQPRRYVFGHGTRERRSESRQVIVDGVQCRTVPLTQGQVAIVDEEDYERATVHLWFAHWNKNIRGYYARCSIGGRLVGLHSFILGDLGGLLPDHVNGDSLDNRRCNLRPATHSENQCNTKTYTSNRTGFRGVHQHSQTGAYVAQISFQRKTHHLGCFKTAEGASKRYEEKRAELHGQFKRMKKKAPGLMLKESV